MLRKRLNKLLILCLLITVGILLQISGLLDPEKLVLSARQYADHWWLIFLLIVFQIILFTFALAGSTFLWVAATLYPPITATIILTAGATIGGVTAYLFSKRLTDEWVHRVENSHIYKLLQKEDNFFTLFALRVMPAFSHSLINYSAGILNIKLIYFVPAAILGIGIKSYVFSKVIYNATTSASLMDLVDISVFAPLVLLSAFILLGIFVKYKLDAKSN